MPPSPSPSPALTPTRPISPEDMSSLPVLERVDFPPPTAGLPFPAVDGLAALLGVRAFTPLEDAGEAVLLPPLEPPGVFFLPCAGSGRSFNP